MGSYDKQALPVNAALKPKTRETKMS